MNDLCIDIDYSQLYKNGQKIGGDVFFLDRDKDSNVITAILSDGLGSGVRANVLASLTAHMARKMSLSPMDLETSAAVIMDTLQVDSEKGISYSTFTIARIIFSDNKSFIRIELVEYDNPDSLRFTDVLCVTATDPKSAPSTYIALSFIESPTWVYSIPFILELL